MDKVQIDMKLKFYLSGKYMYNCICEMLYSLIFRVVEIIFCYIVKYKGFYEFIKINFKYIGVELKILCIFVLIL